MSVVCDDLIGFSSRQAVLLGCLIKLWVSSLSVRLHLLTEEVISRPREMTMCLDSLFGFNMESASKNNCAVSSVLCHAIFVAERSQPSRDWV